MLNPRFYLGLGAVWLPAWIPTSGTLSKLRLRTRNFKFLGLFFLLIIVDSIAVKSSKTTRRELWKHFLYSKKGIKGFQSLIFMKDLEHILRISCLSWSSSISLEVLLSSGKQSAESWKATGPSSTETSLWIQIISDFSGLCFLQKATWSYLARLFFSEGKSARRCFQMFWVLAWGKCFPIKRPRSHSSENSFGNFCFLESGMSIGHEIPVRCEGLWTRKASSWINSLQCLIKWKMWFLGKRDF